MKKLLLVIAGLLLVSTIAKGAYQNITNDLVVGNRVAASSSAVLQVESTTKGFLPPRMNSTQRDAIASPAEGLTIFNTTLNAIQVYAGGAWGNVGGGGSDHPIWTASTVYGIGTIVVDSSDSNWKVYRANTAHTSTSSVFGDDIALGYWDELANNIDNISSSVSSSVAVWDGVTGDKLGQTPVLIDDLGNVTGANDLTMSGNADITGNVVASGSVTATGLEIYSTSVGSIPCPKMTEAERDAIGTPVQGYCVFNTTTNKLNIYDGTDWVSAGGGLSRWLPATNYKQYDVVWYDGDNKIYFANSDFTSGGSFTPSNWTELSNDVNATGSVVDNAVTRWNGTSGDSIQGSLVSIDDSGNIDTPAGITTQNFTATGSVAFSSFDANSVLYTDAGGAITQNNPGFTYNGNTLSLTASGVVDTVSLDHSGTGITLNIANTGTGAPIVVNTTDFVVANGGAVGIGTDSPAYQLEVVGDFKGGDIWLHTNNVEVTTLNDDLNLSANGTGDVNILGNSVYIDGNINVNNAVISGTSDVNPITLAGSGERVVINDPLEIVQSTPVTAAASSRTKLYANTSGGISTIDTNGYTKSIDLNRSKDIYYQQDFEQEAVASWSTGQSVGFGDSGSASGTLSRDTTTEINENASFKFTVGASSTNDWIMSPAINLKEKQAGQHNGITLAYSWDDDQELNLVVECTTGATWQASSSIASSSVTRLSDTFYPDPNCTTIRYGWHLINGATNGSVLRFDDVELSTNPFIYKNIDETAFWGSVKWSSTTNCIWQSSSTSFANFSADADCDDNARTVRGVYNTTTSTAGDADGQTPKIEFSYVPSGILKCEARGALNANGAQHSGWRFSDGANVTSAPANYNSQAPVVTGDFYYTEDQGSVTIQLQTETPSGGQSDIYVTAGREFEISCYHYPLQTSEHIITPAKSNMSDWESYTPTTQGFGTPTIEYAKWRRVGDSMQVMVRLTTGTVTADEARIGLPSSYTILSTVDEYVSAGFLAFGGFVQSHPATVLITGGDSFLNFAKSDGASIDQLTIAQTGSQLLGNSDQISFTATVPIQGWSSNAQFLAAIPVQETCYVKDVKASGTSGGTFTSGAWQTRDLNTTSGDCSWLSLSSNQITLQSGKYEIEWSAPAYGVDNHQSKLYSISEASDVEHGNTSVDAATGFNISKSSGETNVTITTATTYEIRHRCATTKATSGFGQSASFGNNNIYTQVKVTKIK